MNRLSLDSETYLLAPGIAAPRMVCLTTCDEQGDAHLLLRDDAIPLLHDLFDAGHGSQAREADKFEFVLHHARFDMAVFAAADPALLPKIMRLYDEGRVRCTMVREKLLALARGELADEDETGAKRNIRFGLDKCILRRFQVDISASKAHVEGEGDRARVVGNANAWRLRYAELDGVPVERWPPEARAYALDDSRWNLALFDDQTRELHAEGGTGDTVPDEPAQARAAFWLYLMSVRGVRTDPVAVNRLAARTRAEYERMNAIIREAGVLRPQMKKGERVWVKDMAALRSRVTTAYGGRPPMTAGGTKEKKDGSKAPPAVSTEREVLTGAADPEIMRWVGELEHEIVDARSAAGLPDLTPAEMATVVRDVSVAAAEHFAGRIDARTGLPASADTIYNWLVLHAAGERSGVEKVLTTYVPILFQGTQGPICCKFNELVASGRGSSYEPNLQNPPRKGGIRECFVPRPGYVYALCDYSFIELVTLAQTCLDMFGWSALADAINAGLDPHLDMAASDLGISYEEAKIRLREDDPDVTDRRQRAKARNFGFPGGLGAATYVSYARGYGLDLTEQEAKQEKEKWFSKWPEMRSYYDYHGKLTRGNRLFTLVQRPTGRVRGQVGFCDGCNCVDFETEALTRRGWVRGDALCSEDELLTKNAATGALEWQRLVRVHLYPEYTGPLVEFSSTRFSAVTTPNHRWLVSDHRTGDDICVTTDKLSRNGDHRIHRTGRFVGDEGPHSDDLIELAGWFLTDGHAEKGTSSRVRLFQTKPANVERIDALFARLDAPVSRAVRSSRGAVVWSLSASPLIRTGASTRMLNMRMRPTGHSAGLTLVDYEAAGMGIVADALVAERLGVTIPAVGARRRRAGIPRPVRDGRGIVSWLREHFPQRLLTPEFVASLSRRQAKILLDTMILGDGTVQGGGQSMFFTRSESAAGAFQMLAMLVGYSSNVRLRDLSKYADMQKTYPSMKNVPKLGQIWCVVLYRRPHVQVQHRQVRDFVAARGVWCPEVPNGYFVARRGGTVYVTGNSHFQGRAADGIKRAGWYATKECYLRDPYPARIRLGDAPAFETTSALRDGLKGAESPLLGSYPVLFLHDELIIESPEARAAEAVKRLSDVMILGMREIVPDVLVKTEYALCRRWYKGAKPLFDATGRMVPWEPRKRAP